MDKLLFGSLALSPNVFLWELCRKCLQTVIGVQCHNLNKRESETLCTTLSRWVEKWENVRVKSNFLYVRTVNILCINTAGSVQSGVH
jgi:hypothetical protein